MDVEIIDEDENPMLHRTDVRFQLTHDDATPSRLSVRDSLAAKMNKDASEVVVQKLDTKYGMRKTVGFAKIYESASDAKAVEQEHMLQRNKITADGEVETAEDDEGEVDAGEEDVDEAEAAVDEADAGAEEGGEDVEADVDAEAGEDVDESDAEEEDAAPEEA